MDRIFDGSFLKKFFLKIDFLCLVRRVCILVRCLVRIELMLVVINVVINSRGYVCSIDLSIFKVYNVFLLLYFCVYRSMCMWSVWMFVLILFFLRVVLDRFSLFFVGEFIFSFFFFMLFRMFWFCSLLFVIFFVFFNGFCLVVFFVICLFFFIIVWLNIWFIIMLMI